MDEKDFIIQQLALELVNVKIENTRLKFRALQKEEQKDGNISEESSNGK